MGRTELPIVNGLFLNRFLVKSLRKFLQISLGLLGLAESFMRHVHCLSHALGHHCITSRDDVRWTQYLLKFIELHILLFEIPSVTVKKITIEWLRHTTCSLTYCLSPNWADWSTPRGFEPDVLCKLNGWGQRSLRLQYFGDICSENNVCFLEVITDFCYITIFIWGLWMLLCTVRHPNLLYLRILSIEVLLCAASSRFHFMLAIKFHRVLVHRRFFPKHLNVSSPHSICRLLPFNPLPLNKLIKMLTIQKFRQRACQMINKYSSSLIHASLFSLLT